MICFLNGKYCDAAEAKISIFDHGFLYGDGVYETLRTYNSKVWNFAAHYARLQQSLELLDLRLAYDLKALEDIIDQLLLKNKALATDSSLNYKIRITVTRGRGGFNFDLPLDFESQTFLISVEQLLELDESIYLNGVRVITVPFNRSVPEIKSTSMIASVRGRQEAKKRGAFEALFVSNDGFITEGTISNVYLVRRNEIYLPEIEMLPGTTRELIVPLASRQGFNVVFKACEKEAFYEADEIFLSNTLKGIVPVSHIDDFQVGDGKIGPVTSKIKEAFDNQTKQ